MRRILLVAAALFALPLARASADGPSPGAVLGGSGLQAGALRYLTVGNGRTTELESVTVHGGKVTGWVTLKGGWGIPMVAYDGSAGGLSHDHSTLVLEPQNPYTCTAGNCKLTQSRFAIYTPKTLRRRETITLNGTFSLDALSPNGQILYLIQYLPSPNLTDYRVRAYNIPHQRLLPQAIADRTQKGWVMHGAPMTRTTSPSGRYVYTLYSNPGGYPFIHALDTIHATAHCIGLPWVGSQNTISRTRLHLTNDGKTLELIDPANHQHPIRFTINTHNYRVSNAETTPHHSTAWWPYTLLTLPLALLATLQRRRRNRNRTHAAALNVAAQN